MAFRLNAAIAVFASFACVAGNADAIPIAGVPTQSAVMVAVGGAAGELPDNTLEAYRRAIEQGADGIEVGVALTRDGVLVTRSSLSLGASTDVASRPEFASRLTTRVIDGQAVTDWFVSDFTLAELKTLGAVQANPSRPQGSNGLFEVPTLSETISLIQAESARLGRSIELSVNLLSPTVQDALFGARALENAVIATLHAAFGNTAAAAAVIESSEPTALQYLNGRTQLRLTQVVPGIGVAPDGSVTSIGAMPYDFLVMGDARTFADLLTATGLQYIAGYADRINAFKPWLVRTVDDGIDRTSDGTLSFADRRLDGSTGVLELAAGIGLDVFAGNFRDPALTFGFPDTVGELDYYLTLGLDGWLTEFPGRSVVAVPEPASVSLLLVGLVAVGGIRRRRRTGHSILPS